MSILGRRPFLKFGLATATATGLATFSGSLRPSTVQRLKLGVAMPLGGSPQVLCALQRFSEEVLVLSQGGISLEIDPSRFLLPLRQVNGGSLESGTDLIITSSSLYRPRHMVNYFFGALPHGLGPSEKKQWLTQGVGRDLWREQYASSRILPFWFGFGSPEVGVMVSESLIGKADLSEARVCSKVLNDWSLADLGLHPIFVKSISEFIKMRLGGDYDVSLPMDHGNNLKSQIHKQAGGIYSAWSWMKSLPTFEVWMSPKSPLDLQAIVEHAAISAGDLLTQAYRERSVRLLQRIGHEVGLDQGRVFANQMEAKLRPASLRFRELISQQNEFSTRVASAYADFERQNSGFRAQVS